MTMTVTASYSEPRETIRTMSGDVTTLTGVDVTVEYAYGGTTAALAALDRAAEHVRAQILATTTPVIVARPDKQDDRRPPRLQGRGSCPECGSRKVHKEQSVFGGAKTGDLECGDCRASWPPTRDK